MATGTPTAAEIPFIYITITPRDPIRFRTGRLGRSISAAMRGLAACALSPDIRRSALFVALKRLLTISPRQFSQVGVYCGVKSVGRRQPRRSPDSPQ